MNLNTLTSITKRSKKRVGLGHGSGRGKTAGRGTKGQKARGDVPLDFEGGALPLIKRLPFLRGKGRNKSLKKERLVLNVGDLSVFEKGSTVDLEALVKKGLIDLKVAQEAGVKILGDGELSIAVVVKVPVSKSAEEKIKQAGGSVN